jgi:hypothetical protein
VRTRRVRRAAVDGGKPRHRGSHRLPRSQSAGGRASSRQGDAGRGSLGRAGHGAVADQLVSEIPARLLQSGLQRAVPAAAPIAPARRGLRVERVGRSGLARGPTEAGAGGDLPNAVPSPDCRTTAAGSDRRGGHRQSGGGRRGEVPSRSGRMRRSRAGCPIPGTAPPKRASRQRSSASPEGRISSRSCRP